MNNSSGVAVANAQGRRGELLSQNINQQNTTHDESNAAVMATAASLLSTGILVAAATSSTALAIGAASAAIPTGAMAIQKTHRIFQRKQILLGFEKQDSAAYQNSVSDLQNDENLLALGIQKCGGDIFAFSSKRLRNKSKFFLDAIHTKIIKENGRVSGGGHLLKNASNSIRSLKDTVFEAVSDDGLALEFATAELQDDWDVVEEAVMQNGLAMQFASPRLQRNLDMAKLAVAQNGLALQFVATEIRNHPELLRIAFAQNGLAIQFASEAVRNDLNYATTAVRQTRAAYQYIGTILQLLFSNADHLLTRTTTRNQVIDALGIDGLLLEHLSEYQNDEEAVRIALVQNGLALQFAAEPLRNNLNLATMAVTQTRDAYQYVGRIIQTLYPDVEHLLSRTTDRTQVLTIVEENGLFLELLPDYQNDDEVVRRAVRQNGLALQFASAECRSNPEIVQIAIEQNGMAIQFASEALRKDLNFATIAVRQTRDAYQHIGTILQLLYSNADDLIERTTTRAQVIDALGINGLLLEQFPEYQNDEEAVQTALTQNGLAIQFASEELDNNLNLATMAVTQTRDAYQHVGENIKVLYSNADRLLSRTTDRNQVLTMLEENGLFLALLPNFQNDEDAVRRAVKQNGLAIRFASTNLKRNFEIAVIATTQNPAAFEHINESLKTLYSNAETLLIASQVPLDTRNMLIARARRCGQSFPYISNLVTEDLSIPNAEERAEILRQNLSTFEGWLRKLTSVENNEKSLFSKTILDFIKHAEDCIEFRGKFWEKAKQSLTNCQDNAAYKLIEMSMERTLTLISRNNYTEIACFLGTTHWPVNAILKQKAILKSVSGGGTDAESVEFMHAYTLGLKQNLGLNIEIDLENASYAGIAGLSWKDLWDASDYVLQMRRDRRAYMTYLNNASEWRDSLKERYNVEMRREALANREVAEAELDLVDPIEDLFYECAYHADAPPLLEKTEALLNEINFWENVEHLNEPQGPVRRSKREIFEIEIEESHERPQS